MQPETLTSSIKTVASGAVVVEPGLTAKLIDHFLASQNTEISAELFLAEATVKSHINSLFSKLHLRDRVHAVILGREAWPSP